MRANRRRDTGPERRLRSVLHQAGLRYRVDLPIRIDDRLVRPDIAFSSRRLAVFVDGCFWHGCPDHGSSPVINAGYWGPKLARNRDRDREQDALLSSAGWRVLRVWEHASPEEALSDIQAMLTKLRRP